MSSDEELDYNSSESNLEISEIANFDYLHEKIGIYVKDHSGNLQDKSQLVQLLPAEFAVVIVSYSSEERCDKVPGFSCTLRLSIWDKETILQWLKLFEQKTHTVWRVDSTFKCEKSKKLIFKKNFRCQNNQYNHPNRKKESTRKKRIQHTGCPAKISLTIKNHGMQRTSDTYLKEYPSVINIRFTHNHTLRIHKNYLEFSKPKFISPPVVNEEIKYDNEEISDIGEVTNKNIQDKKSILVNNDWSDIICDDVFDERTAQSLYMEKENENISCDEVNLMLGTICDKLKEKLLDKTELYHLPILNFIESFNNFNTDSELINALNSFGANSSNSDLKKEMYIDADNCAIFNSPLRDIVYDKRFEASKIKNEDKFLNPSSQNPYFK